MRFEARTGRGVGIGAPGAVDTESSRHLRAESARLERRAAEKELEKQLDVPVFLGRLQRLHARCVRSEFKAKPKSLVGIFMARA